MTDDSAERYDTQVEVLLNDPVSCGLAGLGTGNNIGKPDLGRDEVAGRKLATQHPEEVCLGPGEKVAARMVRKRQAPWSASCDSDVLVAGCHCLSLIARTGAGNQPLFD